MYYLKFYYYMNLGFSEISRLFFLRSSMTSFSNKLSSLLEDLKTLQENPLAPLPDRF